MVTVNKNTGFKDSYGLELFVGDVLAHYNGYDGYWKVVEKNNEFWLEDFTWEIYGEKTGAELEPIKLDSDLIGGHFKKMGEDGTI